MMGLYGWKGLKVNEQRLESVEKGLRELRTAFDAWFELVAKELGFESEEELVHPYYGFTKVSPRRVKTETKTETTIIRTPPKVCAKRGKTK